MIDLVGGAVVDQVGDRADLQAMLRARTGPGRAARAIVPSSFMISQITAAGVSTGQVRQVAAGLGVAGAHQHAARLRARPETHGPGCTMSEAFAFGRVATAYGARAVGRGNSGRHAFGRFDRHREIGAVHRAVGARHRRERQLSRVRFGQRQADQAARVLGHEVDLLRRDEVGREHQVAFVLAILVVDQHDDIAAGRSSSRTSGTPAIAPAETGWGVTSDSALMLIS